MIVGIKISYTLELILNSTRQIIYLIDYLQHFIDIVSKFTCNVYLS